jgi:NAD(P)-dependent dehydrogenase (short-subunit alcohol dehydrogenase family)
MVALKHIYASNNKIPITLPSFPTAVFVGGTSGIGLGALRAFTAHTTTLSPTIYIVGRSAKSLDALIASLQNVNSTATFIPVQATDLTLVKDAAKAADEIASKVEKVDFLFMSPGFLSLYRENTPEGFDSTQAIRFYSRMRFLTALTPALRKSSLSRVVSVLAGGQEGELFPDDLLLEKNYSLIKAAGQSASLMTLFFEAYKAQPGNENISLVHLYPGPVGGTGLTIKGLGPWLRTLVDWVIAPVMKLVCATPEQAGARVLYAATSGRFRRVQAGEASEGAELENGTDGAPGSGVFLVQGDSSVVTEGKVLKGYKEAGKAEVVYNHTLEQFEKLRV